MKKLKTTTEYYFSHVNFQSGYSYSYLVATLLASALIFIPIHLNGCKGKGEPPYFSLYLNATPVRVTRLSTYISIYDSTYSRASSVRLVSASISLLIGFQACSGSQQAQDSLSSVNYFGERGLISQRTRSYSYDILGILKVTAEFYSG
jgi:hypothetical protein